MLLTTPAWLYLGLTLGSELDARVSHKKGYELELKMQKISEEQKLLREQNTQEENLLSNDSISVGDIRSELFEGDNIITGKTDNGISKLVSGPFAKNN